MERQQFETLKAQVTAASGAQIQHISSQHFTEMALARRTRDSIRVRICVYCRSGNVVLHGKDQNGRQRFKCRGCCKTYNIMTGTPMARARKPGKWATYLNCMTEHMSVRKVVASGIGIHQVTAWRWRHRFLKAAANDNAASLSGVIEAGTTFFPRSFKGSRGWKTGKPPEPRVARPRAWNATKSRLPYELVPVLTALDSGGSVYEAILASLAGIEPALKGRIAAGSVLCSDRNVVYTKVADAANIEHYAVSVGPTEARVRLGLRRVNNHHQGLKHLINECCFGVATKYLGNYLGWHRATVRPAFEGRILLARALV
jgi:transposase-like protein